MKSFTSTTKSIILALVLTIGVASLQAASTWTGPGSVTAPGGNVDVPINVGNNTQSKLGALFLNTSQTSPFAIGLSVFGKSIFNGAVQIAGSTTLGQVLIAQDDVGNVAWSSSSIYGACPDGQYMRGYSASGLICSPISTTATTTTQVPSCRMVRANRYISEQTYVTSGATGSCILYSPTTSGVNQGKNWSGNMQTIHPGGSYGDVTYCQAGSYSSWASWGPSAGLSYADFDYQVCN